MGWGYYGYYGRRGYGGSQPGKKETAASLSTATLQRLVKQKEAEERLQQERVLQRARQQVEYARKEAEERALEEKHGGKEALAKWRAENAEQIRKEQREKAEQERREKIEKQNVNALAELQAELAKLPDDSSYGYARMGVNDLNLNKASVKTQCEP